MEIHKFDQSIHVSRTRWNGKFTNHEQQATPTKIHKSFWNNKEPENFTSKNMQWINGIYNQGPVRAEQSLISRTSPQCNLKVVPLYMLLCCIAVLSLDMSRGLCPSLYYSMCCLGVLLHWKQDRNMCVVPPPPSFPTLSISSAHRRKQKEDILNEPKDEPNQ